MKWASCNKYKLTQQGFEGWLNTEAKLKKEHHKEENLSLLQTDGFTVQWDYTFNEEAVYFKQDLDTKTFQKHSMYSQFKKIPWEVWYQSTVNIFFCVFLTNQEPAGRNVAVLFSLQEYGQNTAIRTITEPSRPSLLRLS